MVAVATHRGQIVRQHDRRDAKVRLTKRSAGPLELHSERAVRLGSGLVESEDADE